MDYVAEHNPEALLLDGFESAFVGMAHRCGQPSLAVYDRDLCVEALMARGMNALDADEYVSVNLDAWVGPHTPLVLTKVEP